MSKEKERLEELERILADVCAENETDCYKCPGAKECEEYGKLYGKCEKE